MRGLVRAAAIAFLIASAVPNIAAAHAGHGEVAMWSACDGLTLGAPCSFENATHDTYRGSCRSISEALVCVRNQPIERAAAVGPTQFATGAPIGLTLTAVVLAALISIVFLAWYYERLPDRARPSRQPEGNARDRSTQLA